MSDEIERDRAATARAVVLVYRLLAAVCRKLPVPISLPEGIIMDSASMIPAVRRTAEVIREEPLSEEHQAYLWGACLKWLAAADMLTALLRDWNDHRDWAILLTLSEVKDTLASVIEDLELDLS
ncbi:hypothetical protein QFW82_23565 [Streptomyces malaysiensis subsp. malaysiensis]|uniref:hypothetical protein n=1 Tax=Streptomyces malaysiensis TaxID=92644 RepID=UPI0024C045EF|nr:hypothetical protein [Streptomyces sp. NA07423]WHX19810.1 hypothetical protein QFW82_23565 [Streptomyces sp. NA07423]